MGNNLNVSIVNEWINRNYAKIAPKFYDKDALHDALCIIYNLASMNKINANTLSIETIRLYYKRCVTNKMFASFACMPVEDSTLEWIIDKDLREDEESAPESKDYSEILEKVKMKMKNSDVKLLDLYLKGFSFNKISSIVGMSCVTVKKIILNKKLWDSYLSETIVA